MIKVFDQGRTRGDEDFEENVNLFMLELEKAGTAYITHVAAKSNYTVIVVEY